MNKFITKTVRLSESETELLTQLCKLHGVKASEIIRQAIREKAIREKKSSRAEKLDTFVQIIAPALDNLATYDRQ